MAFITRYRGLEVQCDSIQDLDALAEQIEASKAAKARRVQVNDPAPTATVRMDLFGSPITPVRRLINELKGPQRRLLIKLSDAKQSDSELRTALGLAGNKALAGALASVSKAAKRVGVDSPIEKTMNRIGRGQREYSYSVRRELAQEVKQALNEHA